MENIFANFFLKNILFNNIENIVFEFENIFGKNIFGENIFGENIFLKIFFA